MKNVSNASILFKTNVQILTSKFVVIYADDADRFATLVFCRRPRSEADFNCPHAARISRPRGVRTGEAYPAFITRLANALIRSSDEHTKGLPGHGLKGIRFNFDGMPLINRNNARQSSSLSFTPSNMTYSHVMRRAFDNLG